MNKVSKHNITKYMNYTIREGRVEIFINNTAFANLLIRDILSLDILDKPLVYIPSACAICTRILYLKKYGTYIEFMNSKGLCRDSTRKLYLLAQLHYYTYTEASGSVFSLSTFYNPKVGYISHNDKNIDYTQAAVLSWALKLPQRLALKNNIGV